MLSSVCFFLLQFFSFPAAFAIVLPGFP